MVNKFETVRWRQVQPAAAASNAASRRPSPSLIVKQQSSSAASASITDISASTTRSTGHQASVQDQSRYTAPQNISKQEYQSPAHVHIRQAIQSREEHTITSPPLISTDDHRRDLSTQYDRIMGDTRPQPLAHHGSMNSSDTSRTYMQAGHDPGSVKDESPARTTPSIMQQSPVSLPSFASLSESAQPRLNGRSYTTTFAVAPGTSATMLCACPQLYPMVQSAANAAQQLSLALNRCLVELDDQGAYEAIEDSPVQTLQRVIDRLVAAESTLSRHNAQAQTSYCRACAGTLDASNNPTNVKRSAADLEMPSQAKRARIDSGERRVAGSPPLLQRLDVAQPAPLCTQGSLVLPSPASLINSAPHFATSRSGRSASPPATTYQSTSSLHNVSTTSAASQHIANLEHQITLKTLSLQSLQSEHTSLLQKWHRERTKTLTIEKKCQAADSEINELAARNDELVEQMKTLETQLSEHERRRVTEVSHARKEKDQWIRMLEMSGLLQQKAHTEAQNLREDNARLSKRLKSCEICSQGHYDTDLEHQLVRTPGHSKEEHPPHPAMWSPSFTNALQSQVNTFRAAFEEAHKQTLELKERFKEAESQRRSLSRAIEDALAGALPSDNEMSHQRPPPELISPTVVSVSDRIHPKEDDTSSQPGGRSSASTTVEALLSTDVDKVDLGFEVLPTTSSPEELVKALTLPAVSP